METVVRCLTLFGLADDNVRFSPISRIANMTVFTSLLVNLYFLYIVYYCVSEAMNSSTSVPLVNELVLVTEIVTAVFVVNISACRLRLVQLCSKAVSSLRDDFQTINSAKTTILNAVVLAVGILYLTECIFCLIYYHSSSFISRYVEIQFSNCHFFRQHMLVTHLISLTDQLVYFYVLLLKYLLQIMLIYTCERTRLFALELAHSFRNGTMDEYQFSRKHTLLLSIVRDLDHQFRWVILVWIVQWILSFCFNFTLLVKNHGAPLFLYLFHVVEVVLPFLSGSAMVIALALIKDVNALFASAVNRRLGYEISEGGHSRYLHLWLKITSVPIQFTFLNCLVIDKSFLTGVFGGAVSYLLFILSIMPNSGQVKHSCNNNTFGSNAIQVA